MSPAPTTPHPFPLFRYFSLTTLVAMVVGAVAVAVVVGRLASREVVTRSEAHVARVAQDLTYELSHTLLFPGRNQGEGGEGALADRQAVQRVVAPHITFADLATVRIYRPDGTLLYSSDGEPVAADLPALARARAGAIVSRPTTLSAPPGSEPRRALTTYLPLYEIPAGSRQLPAGGAVLGVYAITQDVTDLTLRLARTRDAIWLLAAGSMAALYLVLLGIVRRAARHLAADRQEIVAGHHALVEQRDRLDTILANLQEGVALYDSDHRVVFMNRPLVERFGDCRGELCYQALFGLARPCCGESTGERTCGKSWFSLMTPKGETYELFTTPVPQPDGRCWTLELVRDIGERVCLERERVARGEEVERARQAAVAQLLVGLNHELNNSLMGILTTLHVIEQEGVAAAVRTEAAARVRGELERMRVLVTHLPGITEVGVIDYVGGVSMVDPWLVPKGPQGGGIAVASLDLSVPELGGERRADRSTTRT
ncbi:MAG: hypothetical protein CO080_10645 [Nitrospirae bacterium CG_4_9_14_0_8_um_filter_70_14]|nr:MAG: hypothetical protein CO080_10645 [Nitrospirae bacterium CG_4_9_14_0_8_um_filter_70_14]